MMDACGFCGRPLDDPQDALSGDCGGHCWGCISEIEAQAIGSSVTRYREHHAREDADHLARENHFRAADAPTRDLLDILAEPPIEIVFGDELDLDEIPGPYAEHPHFFESYHPAPTEAECAAHILRADAIVWMMTADHSTDDE